MRRPARLRRRGRAPRRPVAGRAGSMAASSARRASTRSRSERVTSGRPMPRGRSAGVACRSRARARASRRLGQARRVVVVGVVGIDDVVEDEASGRVDRRRPAQADRFGGPVLRRPRVELVVRQDHVDDPGRGVGDERLDVRRPGRSRRSRPPASRRCRRRPAGALAASNASRMPGIRRLGRRLVYRLPGPSTMRSASAMAARASSDGRTFVGREPDPLDPGAFA